MYRIPSILFIFLLAISPMYGELVRPTEPIINFQLPLFGDDGYKVIDIHGGEGRYISRDHLEVDRLVMKVYNPGDPINPQNVLQTPHANIYPNKNMADGQDYIFITERDGAYSIIGREWVWHGDEQKLVIESESRVTFRQSFGLALR